MKHTVSPIITITCWTPDTPDEEDTPLLKYASRTSSQTKLKFTNSRMSSKFESLPKILKQPTLPSLKITNNCKSLSTLGKSGQFRPYTKTNLKELEKLREYRKSAAKDSLKVKFLNIAPFNNNGSILKKRVLVKSKFTSLSSSMLLPYKNDKVV